MSGRVRFSSARQIFESFPTAAGDIEGRPLDETPLDFARTLISKGKRFEAIAFSAYLLPRREAVWWGCQCLRALGAAGDNIALAASEAWVRDPERIPHAAPRSSAGPGAIERRPRHGSLSLRPIPAAAWPRRTGPLAPRNRT